MPPRDPIRSGSAFRPRLRVFWHQVLHEHVSPGRLAAGVFVGCLVGTSPFYGLHLPISIGLALALGLNQLVVYGAANVSIPPLAPFVGFAAVQIGTRVRTGRWLGLDLAAFSDRTLLEASRDFFAAWFVGGALLGTMLGLVGGAVVYVAARRHGARDSFAPAIDRAVARFVGAGRNAYWYAYFKYRMDPVYRALEARIPHGSTTLDLGCGQGLLGLLLAEVDGDRADRRVIGFELDESKVRAGEHAARVHPDRIEIRRADLTRIEPRELPPADVVALVDVLHYFDEPTARRVLALAEAALRPGGVLLVRESDAACEGTAAWTRFNEVWAVRFGWNRARGVRFRTATALQALLEERGLAVAVSPTSGPFHPGNVLFEARRLERP